MAREDASLAVSKIVLSEIGSRKELQVEAGLAYKCLRHRRVKHHLNKGALVPGADPEGVGEAVILVVEVSLDSVV